VTTLAALQSLMVHGKSETLEFRRSTAELKRIGKTLGAFLHARAARCSSALAWTSSELLVGPG
jgi:hypothetical protein